MGGTSGRASAGRAVEAVTRPTASRRGRRRRRRPGRPSRRRRARRRGRRAHAGPGRPSCPWPCVPAVCRWPSRSSRPAADGGAAVDVEQVQAATRREHPAHLAQRVVLLVRGQVVEHERREHAVHAAVGVGEPVGVAAVESQRHARPPGLASGGGQHGRVRVEADQRGAGHGSRRRGAGGCRCRSRSPGRWRRARSRPGRSAASVRRARPAGGCTGRRAAAAPCAPSPAGSRGRRWSPRSSLWCDVRVVRSSGDSPSIPTPSTCDKGRTAAVVARSVDGSTAVPLIGYPRTAGLPAISRAPLDAPRRHALSVPGVHAHDFLVLIYLEEGDHTLRVDGRDRALTTGDAFVVAPGTVVAPTRSPAHRGRPCLGGVLPGRRRRPEPRPPPWSPGARTRCCRRSSAAPAAGGSTCGSRRPSVRRGCSHLADLDAELREPARRVRRRRPRPPHAPARPARPPGPRHPGRAGGRAAARGGARPDRRPLPRADLAARRRRRRRAHARGT